MNRRLAEDLDMRPLRRYKTADTRISNSRKLPHDFFGSKKSSGSSFCLPHKKSYNILPQMRVSL